MREFNLSDDKLLSNSVVEAVDSWDEPVAGDSGLGVTIQTYMRNRMKKYVFVIACFVAIIFVAGYTVTIGSVQISFVEAYQTIWNHLTGNISDTSVDFVIWDLRMPRVIGGIFAGVGLAVCGVVMQNTLKNPLADPYTTGVSSGASLGATVTLTVFGGALGSWYGAIGAFIFALVPVAIMIGITKMKDASATTMVMAGIGIMYIFNAVTTMMMMSTNSQTMQAIYNWQVGTLDLLAWEQLPVLIVVVVIGVIISMLISGKLNVLATGDESAKAMGINADRMRIWCLILVGVVSAAVVAFTGLIGFVGLVAPHITRLFIGSDNKFLIPAAGVFGGMLMIIADAVGRIILFPEVIQVGVIMSFIGGPVFLALLLGSKKKMW
ncbi:MAG: iron ABC transporter permease [Candidatus Methanomethylophilaceae archaeon]|nr:iron ABC transporter permease [Candidatus Methanomethylophilaceae archaeon]